MQAIAKVTGVRITPRKVRLVIDLVRGKDVAVALGILANVNKSAVTPVTKLIKSAAANAINNNKMDESKLGLEDQQSSHNSLNTHSQFTMDMNSLQFM